MGYNWEKEARVGIVMGVCEGRVAYQPHPTNIPLASWCASQFPEGFKGWAVDVGASDGQSVNSTHYLEKALGWTVLCIEPNPHFKPMLLRNRVLVETCAIGDKPGDAKLHVNLGNFEAFSSIAPSWSHRRVREEAGKEWESVAVRVRTLDSLLDQYEFPQLDALFIDTEGTEPDVLKGCDLARWKPRVVIGESWDEGALDQYLPGYKRLWRSADNDCYVRETYEDRDDAGGVRA